MLIHNKYDSNYIINIYFIANIIFNFLAFLVYIYKYTSIYIRINRFYQKMIPQIHIADNHIYKINYPYYIKANT